VTVVAEWVSIDTWLSVTREVVEETNPPEDYIQALKPPGWTLRAKCVSYEPELFFGTEQRPALTVADISRARSICHNCPVRMECLTHALIHPERHGIWAGTTGRERERIWRLIEEGQTSLPEVLVDYKHRNTSRYERLSRE
jgi:WhiB family redox-sensing transcriptional regulator